MKKACCLTVMAISLALGACHGAKAPAEAPDSGSGAALTPPADAAIEPIETKVEVSPLPPIVPNATSDTAESVRDASAEPVAGTSEAPSTASPAGTLAGSDLASRLGGGFGPDAQWEAAQAERHALATDAPASWQKPAADSSGEIRPLRSFTDAAGRECREYSHTVAIAQKQETATGIACRESDGRWTLVGD